MSTPVPPSSSATGTAASLDAALSRGIAWIGVFRWLSQIVAWVSTLLVLRFVQPGDYGIMNMVMPFVSLTAMLTEFGIGQAIFTLRRDNLADLRQLHTVSISLGLLGTLLCATLAGSIATFQRDQRLLPVLLVLSLTFVLDASRIVPMARFALALDYRRSALFEATKTFASAVTILAAAVAGFGYWSYAVGYLLASVIAAAAVAIRHPLGLARPHRASVEPVLRLSAALLLSRAAWFVYSNADFVTVGRVLGAEPLGFYALAWTLATLPGEKLVNVVSAVTLPLLPKASTDLALMKSYVLRLTRLLGILVIPALAWLLLAAGDAIPFAFGSRWQASVPYLRILVVFHCVNATSIVCMQVLPSTGNTRIASRAAVSALAFLLPAFYFGATHFGVLGVAYAWLLGLPIAVFYPLHGALKAIHTTFGEYLAALLPGFIGAALASAGVLSAWAVLRPADGSTARTLLSVVFAAIPVGAYVWWGCRDELALILPRLARVRPAT